MMSEGRQAENSVFSILTEATGSGFAVKFYKMFRTKGLKNKLNVYYANNSSVNIKAGEQGI